MASAANNNNMPNWKASGDFFDVCKCNLLCPCEFAEAPTYGDCVGEVAWYSQNGQYGQTPLDRLNALGVGSFTGALINPPEVSIVCTIIFVRESKMIRPDAVHSRPQSGQPIWYMHGVPCLAGIHSRQGKNFYEDAGGHTKRSIWAMLLITSDVTSHLEAWKCTLRGDR